jgi:hypothetical protein
MTSLVGPLFLGYGETPNYVGKEIYTFGTGNSNGKNFKFIFLTCIWVQNVAEKAHEFHL